jgi:hypothetical protein
MKVEECHHSSATLCHEIVFEFAGAWKESLQCPNETMAEGPNYARLGVVVGQEQEHTW